MKHSLITTLVMLGAGLLWTGCGDSASDSGSAEGGGTVEPMRAAVESAAKSAADATKAAGDEVTKAYEAAKPQLEEAAKAVRAAAADAGAAAQAAFTDAVSEVRKLIQDGKGSEAMQKLNAALANLKLTPEQKEKIEELKRKAQEVFSAKGVESAKQAASDLFKPKPKPEN